MTFRKVWIIRCHSDGDDCSNDDSPDIELDGRFYCKKHLKEKRNAKLKV